MTHNTLGKSLDEIIQMEVTSKNPHVYMKSVEQLINFHIQHGFDEPYHDDSATRIENVLNFFEDLKQKLDNDTIHSIEHMNAALWITTYQGLALEVYTKLFDEREIIYES